MADPVAALIAAHKAATPGPLRPTEVKGRVTRLDSPNNQCYINPLFGKIVATPADFAYIRAAYDPALILALIALQARVAALEAALAPLAALHIESRYTPAGDDPVVVTFDPLPIGTRGKPEAVLTVGDVRRARALLGRE